jgi:hypothetical protein
VITWDAEPTRSNHMYRCAYCSSITTAKHKTVGRRIRGSRGNVQSVIAYECGECGNTTCFDGNRQIPAVTLYPNCYPLEQYSDRARTAVVGVP